jgi:1-acyl-sn-glycerol-3-phosphate acyltransferase
MTIRCGLNYLFFRGLFRILASVLFDLKVYGRDNIPKDGGALLAPNHLSYLDPVLVGVQIARPVSYLAKSELFRNPFFGWGLRSVHAYPVRQGAGDVGAIRETIARLQEGHLLNIFPEGSRSEDGQLAPIQAGVALVVRRARVPVVPVAIIGSYQAWPRHRKLFRPHPVRILYGRPLVLHDLKPAEITQMIDRELRRLLAELETMHGPRGEK